MPKKEVRGCDIPFAKIYMQYGSLLIDKERWEEAQEILLKALEWNPSSAHIIFELCETYKHFGQLEKYYETIIDAFKYCFTETDLARCYRYLGWYFVEKEGVDLDLYFPKLNCYGDLKCHSISSQGIQGNDESTVVNQIKCNGHVFYIVGEHVTVKDSDFNYEVTKYWNSFQQKEDLMSYANKMKNRIILLKSYILDINANNYNKLTQFKQGVNSDGKLRKPKIMINTSNIEDFKVSELIISGVTK